MRFSASRISRCPCSQFATITSPINRSCFSHCSLFNFSMTCIIPLDKELVPINRKGKEGGLKEPDCPFLFFTKNCISRKEQI